MAKAQAQADLVRWALEAAESKRETWAELAIELAEKLRLGCEVSEIKPVAERLLHGEGLGKCVRVFDDHRREIEGRLSEGLRRAMGVTVHHLWSLPVRALRNAAFDWVPAEQSFRAAARILMPTPDRTLVTSIEAAAALADEFPGVTRDTVNGLTRRKRDPLVHVDKNGRWRSRRFDLDQVRQKLRARTGSSSAAKNLPQPDQTRHS